MGLAPARGWLSHARAQLESMYPGFARHSPAAAQPAQFGFWSMHAAQPAPSPAAAAAKSTRRIQVARRVCACTPLNVQAKRGSEFCEELESFRQLRLKWER